VVWWCGGVVVWWCANQDSTHVTNAEVVKRGSTATHDRVIKVAIGHRYSSRTRNIPRSAARSRNAKN
jgi:hypothetical protein